MNAESTNVFTLPKQRNRVRPTTEEGERMKERIEGLETDLSIAKAEIAEADRLATFHRERADNLSDRLGELRQRLEAQARTILEQFDRINRYPRWLAFTAFTAWLVGAVCGRAFQ